MKTDAHSPMLDAALRYAELGLPVFPCKPETKAPLVGPDKDAAGNKVEGTGGFHKATTDADQIKAWWAKWPTAMIGMPTGEKSGIDVLDLDVDEKKGKDGLVEIPDWKSRSPIIVRTPRGGRHLWFKSDGSVSNSTDNIALGVDTRGRGGYVILPPSKNGVAAYRFEHGNEHKLEKLSLFPDDLKARLGTDDKAPSREPVPEHLKSAGGVGKSFDPRDYNAPTAEPERVAAAMEAIPNPDVGWEEWNKMGMTIWRATEGADEGRKIFHDWSKRSKKFDEKETDERWRHYFECPPKKLGAGSIFHWASEADPNWWKKIPVPSPAVTGSAAHQELRAVEFTSKTTASKPSKFNATPFEWIDPKQIPKRQWLYRPHYIREFLSLLFSSGGKGKSSLLIVEALAMVSGKPLLNVKPEKELRVWYWNGEDPALELQRRFAAAIKHYELKPEDIGDRLFIDSGRTLPIVIVEERNSGLTSASRSLTT